MSDSNNTIPDFVAEGFEQSWNHLDASHLTEDKVLEADVVIVGSGAGGGNSAEILAEAGLKVIIVEEGPLQTSKDFQMKEDEAYSMLYQESAARQTKDRGIKIFQGRMVGGGTGINWTTSFRTPPTTLKYWSEEMGVKGFSADEMRPWFEWAEKRYKIQQWTVPPNANNIALEKGCEKLGASWGKISRNVNGCLDLGYCGTGCPVNAKQSTLVTTIPGALKAGATLISKARAEDFVLSKGKITELKCRAMTPRGNAEKHDKLCKKYSIHFFDCGVSGGIWGLKNGYTLMVGGPKNQFKCIEPFCKALSAKGGYGYFGNVGAGHFVKSVHNIVEYVYLQGIAEGVELLKGFKQPIDIVKATSVWRPASVVNSWLMDLANVALKRPDFKEISPINMSVTINELKQTVKSIKGYAPAFEIATKIRVDKSKKFTLGKRMIAATRREFGGHAVKKNK